ncbi:hypothetical protein AZF37_00830 [endosymbiont 'TC1' of Trimyema compressum]|nr:hypothetical protein AZF37_00830 [endosymbiont 'TC1' of Trimyema compressum]
MDIVSIKYTTNILKETLYGSCDSILSQYNQPLRNQYSLFALGDAIEYYEDQEALLLDNFYGKDITLENHRIEVRLHLTGEVLKNKF